MNDLSDVLERQVARVQPVPDLADVHGRANRRRRRAKTARLVTTSCVVVAAVVGLFAVTRLRSASNAVAVVPPSEVQVSTVGGLVVTDAGVNISYPHSTLERVDLQAGTSPFAIVVRRNDGRLGSGSAVVTYPVVGVQQPDGEIRTDSSTGTDISTAMFSRPGGQILVRAASLTTDEITAIANAARVVGDRPVVSLPESMGNFAVVASGTVRTPMIRESRYGCDALGEAVTLGGLCYTGLVTSPGFEAALYSRSFQPGPTVQGHPSFVSSIGGGSATLAWEPLPGIIAYVGYSGPQLTATQVEALARFAQRTTLITPAEWAATKPQVVHQDNDW